MALKQRKAIASPHDDAVKSAEDAEPTVIHARIPSFTVLLAIGGLLRLALIAYGSWHDAHRALKYTDIDYAVFSDASEFILRPTISNRASGPLAETLAKFLRLDGIGCPYERATYRYTPLLALLLLGNGTIHPTWGKLLFVAGDLAVAAILHRLLTTGLPRMVSARQARIYISIVWLLNPFIANISTRGSSESFLGVIVLSSLLALHAGHLRTSAICLGVAIHFKLYPVIYGLPVIVKLATPGTSLLRINSRQISYAVWTAATFAISNAVMYAIWGYPFLAESYLYHLTRLDHRHNFSYHFYDIYLGLRASSASTAVDMQSIAARVLGSSFLPQFGAVTVVGAGLALHRAIPLSFIWFLQTFTFVTFNRVCTSQYFMWYLWFLPVIIPHYTQVKLRIGLSLLAIWVAGQALWLAVAYRLELEGQPVYFELWLASLVFFASQITLILLLLRYFR